MSEEGEGLAQALSEFESRLRENQEPLDPEFQKVIDDNYWELVESSN